MACVPLIPPAIFREQDPAAFNRHPAEALTQPRRHHQTWVPFGRPPLRSQGQLPRQIILEEDHPMRLPTENIELQHILQRIMEDVLQIKRLTHGQGDSVKRRQFDVSLADLLLSSSALIPPSFLPIMGKPRKNNQKYKYGSAPEYAPFIWAHEGSQEATPLKNTGLYDCIDEPVQQP
jgi:hypothetical protein